MISFTLHTNFVPVQFHRLNHKSIQGPVKVFFFVMEIQLTIESLSIDTKRNTQHEYNAIEMILNRRLQFVYVKQQSHKCHRFDALCIRV